MRRLPKEGDEVILRARVTRIGRNDFDTRDAVTVRISGYDIPVTLNADYINPDPED